MVKIYLKLPRLGFFRIVCLRDEISPEKAISGTLFWSLIWLNLTKMYKTKLLPPSGQSVKSANSTPQNMPRLIWITNFGHQMA